MYASLLTMLFDRNQGFRDALEIPGDVVFMMLESSLDDSLSTLEPDQARRAREQVSIIREYGSWDAFIADAAKTGSQIAPPVVE